MKTQRNKGFTLIELMIVIAIIAIIAAIAIPNLLAAKASGNEASAKSSLRTLVTTSEQFRTSQGDYPTSLTVLNTAGYIDSSLSSGTKSDYVFIYASTPGSGVWSCTASPTTFGSTGSVHFFVDQSGVIRFDTTAGGGGDVTDPPLN